MTKILSLVFAATLALSAAACGDDASCDKVVDHTLKLMPPELKAQMGGDKKALIDQCKAKTSEAERKCALKADSMEDLMKCRKS